MTILRHAAAAGIAMLLLGCATERDLDPQLLPSGVPAPLPEADFAAYVEASREHIVAARHAAGLPALAPEVVEDRAPFELTPPAGCPRTADGRLARGALLIHGLGGTPYDLRDLGERLAAACHLVRAPLLPGHGTVPGDLTTIDRAAWLDAIDRAVVGFEGRVDRLDVIGFSDGAALALDSAIHAPPPGDVRPGALVLLSPAIGVENGLLGSMQGLIGDLASGGAWVEGGPGLDPLRYETMPGHAVAEMDRLRAELAWQDPLLDRPILVAISADDATVDAEGVRAWFCRRLVGPRRLIWYTTSPGQSLDCRFVTERSLPADPTILDLSHTGLPVAPGNPRYGRASRVFDCRHYYSDDSPDWLVCADPTTHPTTTNIRYGEITPTNLERHLIRRLSYDPDFDALAAAIVAFLAAAPGLAPRPSPPRPAS